MNEYRIVVDAGHGGSDPGAVSGNLKEKDFNNISWLPVYSYTEEKNNLKPFQDGYKSEVTILRGVLIKPNQKKHISLLNHNDILHYQNEERWL